MKMTGIQAMNELDEYFPTVDFRTETGRMTIFLDEFFPTGKNKLKKLLKVIDYDWRTSDQNYEKICNYINSKVEFYKDKERYEKRYNQFIKLQEVITK